MILAMEETAYRIINEDGTSVQLVRASDVALALEQWNALRELDIDGNPIGLYTAIPSEPGKGWGV